MSDSNGSKPLPIRPPATPEPPREEKSYPTGPKQQPSIFQQAEMKNRGWRG